MNRITLFLLLVVLGVTLSFFDCASEPKTESLKSAPAPAASISKVEALEFQSELLKLKNPELNEASIAIEIMGAAHDGNVSKARLIATQHVQELRSDIAGLKDTARRAASVKIPSGLPPEAQKGYQSYLDSMGKILDAKAQNLQSLVVFAQTGNVNALTSYFNVGSKLLDTEQQLDAKKKDLDNAVGGSGSTQ